MANSIKRIADIAKASLAKTNRTVVLARTDLSGVENRITDLETHSDKIESLKLNNIISDIVVENTTTETNVYSCSMYPDLLLAREVYELKLNGKYSTANATDKVYLKLKINNVTIQSIGVPAGLVTDTNIEMESSFTIRSVGTNGTLSLCIKFIIPNNQYVFLNNYIVDINTTNINVLTIDSVWDNANSGNILTINNGYMKLVQ